MGKLVGNDRSITSVLGELQADHVGGTLELGGVRVLRKLQEELPVTTHHVRDKDARVRLGERRVNDWLETLHTGRCYSANRLGLQNSRHQLSDTARRRKVVAVHGPTPKLALGLVN